MRARRTSVALAAGALLLAGCSYDNTPLPDESKAAPTTPAAPPDCTNDSGDLASYPPSTTGGPAVDRIRERGRLVVGVSADTFQMAAPDRETGRLQGFDIDIAKAIGAAIFGSSFKTGTNIQWKVITAAERIPLLQSGDVDIVVRNMTITCDRWEQIAFSAEYYHAVQKVLLRADLAAGYESAADLAGKRVCAPTGSTSLTNIKEIEPDAILSPAPNHTGCLVKLQEGDVDAITGDDTVLAGLAAQDPFAVVPDNQPPLSEAERTYGEPYGVGVNSDDTDLVAFINSVLRDLGSSGEWDRMYHHWLEPYLGGAEDNKTGATQPVPDYNRS